MTIICYHLFGTVWKPAFTVWKKEDPFLYNKLEPLTLIFSVIVISYFSSVLELGVFRSTQVIQHVLPWLLLITWHQQRHGNVQQEIILQNTTCCQVANAGIQEEVFFPLVRRLFASVAANSVLRLFICCEQTLPKQESCLQAHLLVDLFSHSREQRVYVALNCSAWLSFLLWGECVHWAVPVASLSHSCFEVVAFWVHS